MLSENEIRKALENGREIVAISENESYSSAIHFKFGNTFYPYSVYMGTCKRNWKENNFPKMLYELQLDSPKTMLFARGTIE